MRAKGRVLAGSFWPSEQQRLLLCASLLGDERGQAAWRTLRRDLDVHRLEKGSVVLLPLLYEKLTERGAAETFLPKLKGVYRYQWYGNRVGLEALRDTLAVLRDGDIETIVLGDAPLILRYYKRLGVRPLDEVAVLVRPQQLGPTFEVLGDAGWTIAPGGSGRQRVFHRTTAGRRARCSLYWRILPELEPMTDTRSGETFWEARQEVGMQGIPAFILGTTHELLRTLVGGARSARSPVLWIADAMTILGSSAAEVDWERLHEEAVTRRCVLRVRDALVYLAHELDAAVPQDLLDRFDATPSTRRERLAHRISGRGALFGSLPATFGAYLVATQDRSMLRSAFAFPHFLREEWGLEHLRELPGAAVRRGASAISTARARRQAVGGAHVEPRG